MFNFFKKSDVHFKFADSSGVGFYTRYPPVLAKDLKPMREHQEKKYGEYKFPGCPGMHDYSRMGYIIPAWVNFHIKANKAGTIVIAGTRGVEGLKRPNLATFPTKMETDFVDGSSYSKKPEHFSIYNCGGPWKIITKKEISLLVLPALYHSNFLDDVDVFPGVVDYKNTFAEMNFIISPKRECELEIHAGDPILHVIPFVTKETIVASYGRTTQYENDFIQQPKHFHETSFYRRYSSIKKKFKLNLETIDE